MNRVILKEIALTNFKGIASAKIIFDEKQTKLFGENGSGKTTIQNAFKWVLLQNVADVLPMLNNKEIPNLVTSVEAILEINGFEYKLSRTSKGKYQLNQETGKMNKVTNENSYKIDDIELKEKDYKAKLADLLGSGAFENLQILTDKDFFNTDTTNFKWTDRRKFLFDMCEVKDAVQDIISKDKYNDIKEYIIKGYATSDIKSMLAKEKKGYKSTQDKNNILIEQKTKEITELSTIDFEEIEKELKTAKSKLNKILSSSKKENQAEQINELQNQLIKLNKEKAQLEMKDINEQNALRTFMNTTYNECQNLKLQYQVEEDKLHDLLNNQTDTEIKTECPYCGTPYTEEYIKELQEKAQSKIEESDRQVEKQTGIVRDIQEKYNSKKAQFEQTKEKLDNFKPSAEIKEVQDRILSTQEALQSAKATELTNLSNEQKTALETQISGLERELAKSTFIEKAKLDIHTWKNQNKEVADKIIAVERKERNLADYVKEQTDTIVETINSRFSNGISWALYKETYKNGEGGIEEDCICMYNRKRHSSLSMGEKNKANLEVIKVLQDYYGVRLPLFADNSETTTINYDVDTQIIELYAQKGKKLDDVVKIEEIYKGE